MWDYRAAITNVHDADSLSASIDCGFGYVREGMKLRLLGVWAPELREPGGVETRAFVVDWVARYALVPLRFPFIVTTARGPRSDREVTTLERYVATVETIDHSHSLNMDVIAFITEQGYGGGTGS